jgi:hypothetical protein
MFRSHSTRLSLRRTMVFRTSYYGGFCIDRLTAARGEITAPSKRSMLRQFFAVGDTWRPTSAYFWYQGLFIPVVAEEKIMCYALICSSLLLKWRILRRWGSRPVDDYVGLSQQQSGTDGQFGGASATGSGWALPAPLASPIFNSSFMKAFLQ